MRREPLFMGDLHKRQSREYERCKKLNLRRFIRYINNQVAMIESRVRGEFGGHGT